MSIELINPDSTYEINHPSGAVFTLRHWTVGLQVDLEVRLYEKKDIQPVQLVSLEREFKLDAALAGWRGVTESGKEVPCTPENKRKLPFQIVVWILQDIDERSGVRMPAEEKKN